MSGTETNIECLASPTVLFVDVVGSTVLFRTLGDSGAERIVRLGLERAREAVRAQRGRVIKSLGDGLLCLFADANHAAEAAFAMQRETRTPIAGGDIVRLRIGFVSGPVLEREGDIFGDVVNVAARVCGLAKPELVLTTEETAKLLDAGLAESIRFYDRTTVKGISETLTIVQLVWDARSSQTEFITMPSSLRELATQAVVRYGEQTLTLGPADRVLTIGRDLGCGLVVTAPFASRVHARIEYQRGKFILLDESTNGTYVAPAGTPPERAIYVRNEAFPLLGEGQLTLGTRQEQDEHQLRYAIS